MMQPASASFNTSTNYPCDYLQQIPLSVSQFQALQLPFYQDLILSQQQQQQQQHQHQQQQQLQQQQQQQFLNMYHQSNQIQQQPPLILQQQNQVPQSFVFPQEQQLDTLTAQLASIIYSNMGNSSTMQPLQLSALNNPSEPQLQSQQQSSQIPLSYGQDVLQHIAGPVSDEALNVNSLIDQLVLLAQTSNDSNISLAAALAAAQLIQESQNYNFSLTEAPTAPLQGVETAATSDILTNENKQDNHSLTKQTSETHLVVKPSIRTNFEKLAFSPVDGSHARTSSPHSSFSRISNSQIHHQPFDNVPNQRESKTFPIVFLQHPASHQIFSENQKQSECNDEALSNSSGSISKGIQKRKKNSSFKIRQTPPSQSSDSFTHSSSLTVNLKKMGNDCATVPLKNNLSSNMQNIQNKQNANPKSTKAPMLTPLAQSLAKDTYLFNDLLDPLILLVRESEQKQKEQQQQKSKVIKDIQNNLNSINNDYNQQISSDNNLINEFVAPSSPESSSLLFQKKVLRISPRRRVFSTEEQQQQVQQKVESSDSKNSQMVKEVSDDEEEEMGTKSEQKQKKVKRLKRISQIVKDKTINNNKHNNNNHKNNNNNTLSQKCLKRVDSQKKQVESNNQLMEIIAKTRTQQNKISASFSVPVNITTPTASSDSNAFTNIDSFSEATQALMNQFEKHYLKTLPPNHVNNEYRINEFKAFMKNAHKNDEMIGLLLNPRACSFSISFLDFLRVPALKWIKKNVEKKKQEIYIQLIQIFKSEESGVACLRPRKNRGHSTSLQQSK